MKRNTLRAINLIALLALALPRLALGQAVPDSLLLGVIGSGGGTATSASYSLSGTAGQPAADIGLSGGTYSHDGGFWPAAQALTAAVSQADTFVIDIAGSGDYTSFSAAVTALAAGISKPTVFQVKQGTYTEQITIPLINGVNATNTITFEPDPANTDTVHLEYTATSSADNWVVKLEFAQYITFQSLTIQALDAVYTRVLDIVQDADHNNLLDNTLIGSATTSSGLDQALISLRASTGNKPDSVIIRGNTFLNGAYGVTTHWTMAGEYITDLEIDDNTFSSQTYRGVEVANADGPVIGGNQIMAAATPTTDYRGIYAESCINDLEIVDNVIEASNSGTGISLNSCTGSTSLRGLVANNVISLGATNNIACILVENCNYLNIYHNTGLINSNPAVYLTSGTSINLKNNIFVNTGDGYALYTDTPPTAGYISSNNDLYTTGPNLAYWSTTVCADLAALQAASGKEANSISEDPKFVGTGNDPYQLQNSSPAIGAGDGTIIAAPYNVDIASVTRPFPAGSQPDLGAYEHSLGTPLERFQVDASLPITGSARGVIAGDIRGDGLARIVVSSNSPQYIYVFGYSAGSYVEEWSDFIPDQSGRLVPIAVGDVDNDFQNEFLVASRDSVYMYEWNGTTYKRVLQQALAGANIPTVILDLDRDGLNEVVLGQSGSVGIFKYQVSSNSLELVWSTAVSSSLQIAAGDVDHDGQMEVCYIETGSPGKIVVLGYDGANYVVEAEIIGFANGLGGGAIGDFNGDGKQEIITGLFNVAAASWPIYRVEYDGSTYQVSTLLSDATMGMFQAHAGDIDGDGLPEANVLRNSGNSFIVEFESSAYVVSEAIHNGACIYGDIADVDGDGLGELVVGSDILEIVSDVLGTIDPNAPAAPTGLTVAPWNTQVTLNWAANLAPDLSHYLVYQSTAPGFTPSGANLVGPVSKYNTVVVLSGLTNDTPYYFRIAAVDEAGNESAPSAEVNGTPVNPPPTATTTAATNVSFTSATLNGTVNPNGTSTTVTFEWGTTMSYGNVVTADQSPVDGSVDVSVSATIAALVPSTTYHYRVVAENTGGPSTGVDRTFTTPDQAGITVDNQIVTGTGTVNFPNTSASLAFDYTVAPGEAVVEVIQFDFAPGGNMPEGFALFANDYWEINYTGGGTFTIAITFNLGMSGVNQGNTPSQFRLMRRAISTDEWAVFAQGAGLSDSTVTFKPISVFSQFTVAKEADIQAPSTTISPIAPVDLNTAGIIVKAVITDKVGVVQAGLQYILGGGGKYSDPVAMQPTGALANEWGATIPGAITFKGIAFRVLAADAAGNVDTSLIQTIEVKFDTGDLTTNIPGGAYAGAGGFPQDKWRLISVPATLIDNSVDATIGDNLIAASSDTTWRLYEYTHNTNNQWRSATQFAPDEAYWLQRRVGDDHFDTGGGQTHDIGRFDIELQPGWNLISNPYPFAVPIQLPSQFWGPLTYRLDSGSGKDQWQEVSQLRPWEGYAIQNKTSSLEVISLSGIPVQGAAKAMLAKGDQAAPAGWLLHLDVVGDTYADGLNRIGRLEGASEELDYFDHPEPPYIDGFVSLAMERPEWGAGRTRFTSDVRSLEEANGVWDLALYTRGEKGPITLSTELQGDLPAGSRVVLLDVLTQEVQDLLADDRPVTITDYREDFPYRLKVVAGSASYVDQTTEKILAELPSKFALAQNYPNPFNPDTHLRYSLIRPARVTLKVYNLLGQEVVTLVDGWQDLGHYEVIWDGRDRFGSQAATGIYFAVYMAEGRTFARKMVMMK